ncbi:MAG: hypothetical protein K9H49_04535 [Bacteroidales bacterium]|nr:hypothetical protein [Bacteroidales bacterium]MCF8389083.1 hypothetical protein [Bacteroidales bacterium]
MKKLNLLVIAVILFSFSSYAQNTNKELTKELKEKAIKEARKEAKSLEKDGWYVPPGSLPMAKLVESSWLKQLETKEDGSQRYIYADGNGVAESKSAAEMQSIELGKLLLAGQIETQMNALISANVGNAQLSTEEAASVTEIVASAKNIIATELGYVNPSFKLYRDVKKGTIEVQSRLFYDTDQSLQIAKKVVREELKNKLKLNEEKLETLMGIN